VLDLTRCWNGQALSPARPLEFWQELLLEAVTWLGPLPVTILSRSKAMHPDLAAVVRFAHRLECPVCLYGQGEGIDDELALRLSDVGLHRVCVVVGGVTSSIHEEVAGRSLDGTTAAVWALLKARDARRMPMDLVVDFPCTPVSVPDLAGVKGWARQVGVDGFAASPPFLAPISPHELPREAARMLRELESGGGSFRRTAPGTTAAVAATWRAGDRKPGSPREGGDACPIGGLRLDVRACGRFGACPFKRSIGCFEPGVDLRQAWTEGTAHFADIAACQRRCHHPELLQRGLAPPWERGGVGALLGRLA